MDPEHSPREIRYTDNEGETNRYLKAGWVLIQVSIEYTRGIVGWFKDEPAKEPEEPPKPPKREIRVTR